MDCSPYFEDYQQAHIFHFALKSGRVSPDHLRTPASSHWLLILSAPVIIQWSGGTEQPLMGYLGQSWVHLWTQQSAISAPLVLFPLLLTSPLFQDLLKCPMVTDPSLSFPVLWTKILSVLLLPVLKSLTDLSVFQDLSPFKLSKPHFPQQSNDDVNFLCIQVLWSWSGEPLRPCLAYYLECTRHTIGLLHGQEVWI